jgi:CBS domain containing-hemolysin-like protein
MTLERGDGFYLGPVCMNYGLVVFAYLAPVLLLGFSEIIPLKLALTISLPVTLLLPIFLYRWCWSLWLMVYYFCLPEELHANRPEDSDDLSFEEEQRNVEY